MKAGQREMLHAEAISSSVRRLPAEAAELVEQRASVHAGVLRFPSQAIEGRERHAVLVFEDEPCPRNPVVHLTPHQVADDLERRPRAGTLRRMQPRFG